MNRGWNSFQESNWRSSAIRREHNPLDEWVYNLADIDGSKVVWAREMDTTDNLELIHYYRDRKVWLVEPDAMPARIVPYPAAETAEPRSAKTESAERARASGRRMFQELKP